MKSIRRISVHRLAVSLLAIFPLLSACEGRPAQEPTEPSVTSDEPAASPNLGPPLVDHPEKLIRLDPVYDVWIDKQNKRVVAVAQVCGRDIPLEMFACTKNTKEYESILVLNTKAAIVHAALLAVGAKNGSPATFTPQFAPAQGDEIEISLAWKDERGAVQRAKAQDWIRVSRTKQAMDQRWVFAGSGFWTDPATGDRHYLAESGELICVANFSSATLDLVVRSSSSNEALEFEAFTERIPPKGTAVTMILTPKSSLAPAAKAEGAPKP